MATDAFQVDLRGVVDLLSHHLYSSPRVYLRELVQNAVDAVTVRGPAGAGDDRPALRLVPADVAPDGRLHALDSGVGLDEDDVRTFLATIGRSSKRDELGLARSDLLGQFGIGLLSCFMVTDRIEVVTRRDGGPWVRWVGHADGSFELAALPDGRDLDDTRREWLGAGPGTCVALSPRRAAERFLDRAAVTDLARHHAAYLPHRVVVSTGVPGEDGDPGDGGLQVAPTVPPWRLEDPARRRAACEELAVEHLGGRPFQVLPIRVPRAGLDGVAVVAGRASSSTRQGGHRVHLKGMLLSDSVPGLVPEWAFFVRCAVDTELLRPTANREALFEDDLLADTREEIGRQVRSWLVRLARTDPHRMAEFLQLHHLAVKAMALEDDQMLRLLLPLLPFETNQGTTTVPDLLASTDTVRVTASLEDFRQVQVVMAAQGVALVNGGYTFDLELLRRVPDVVDGAVVEVVSAADVDAHVRTVPDVRLREAAAALASVRAALDAVQVDVALRTFAPASLPALLLDDRDARRRRESRTVAAGSDDTWGALLATFDDAGSDRTRLLLNDESPTVRKVLALQDDRLRRLAAESLYCRALLSGHHPLRPVDTVLLDRSFNALLDLAVGGGAGGRTDDAGAGPPAAGQAP